MAVAACFSTGAIANPVAPTVVNGTASFNQTGNVLTVTNSNGAAINWNSFSIAAGEPTRFVQPSASSSVLNRVLGGDPSSIYGTLSSNGRVWLVNPAGIMVGPSGRIDVVGFVASTLHVSTADFLANKLDFNATPGAGNVVNQGEITTPSGGAVYLVGTHVTNAGIITTPQGETILAAGQTVSLIDTATPGVKVEITGAEGNATNLGTIVADAGRIGIAGVIVRNSGTLNASSAVSEGGRVFLRASQDAYVDGNGRIITTGTTGGRVEVLGERVAVMDNASIDASGVNGGGTILVGGDYQGKNPAIQNASVPYFGPDATLKADAQNLGAGGTVIVWADDTTRAYGTISARGGANGGDGGFVETSGKRHLAVDGIRVDTRAPHGTTGSWLLDPDELTLVEGSGVDVGIYGGPVFTTTSASSTIYSDGIETALSTTNVTLQTGGGGGNGSITATGVTINNGTAAYGLTLAAYGGGSATGDINITNSSFYVYGGVTLLAGWNGGGYTSADVISGKGDINIQGSTIHSGGGAVNLWAGHSIALSSDGVSGAWVSGTAMDVAAQNLTLTGGYGGVGLSTGGVQNIAIYGGLLALSGGSGAGGNEFASIEGDTQNITFYGGGILNMTGGSVGSDNYASIEATGDQVIHAEGVAITLTGGSSGGVLDDENSANISLADSNTSGSQTVYAGSITINGGSAAYGGAGFGVKNGNNQTFDVTGNLTMNGGSSANSDFLATPAYIGSEYGGGTINVNVGGNIILNGGSSLGGGVVIGSVDDSGGPTSVTLNAGGNITATGNTGGVWLGVKNLTGSYGGSIVALQAGNSGNGGNIKLNGPGGIQVDDSGAIGLFAWGNGLGAYGDIVQTGGSIKGGDISLYADGNVELLGTIVGGVGGSTFITAGDGCADACFNIPDKHITVQSLQANGGQVDLKATGSIFANTQDAGSIYAEIYNSNSGGIVINNSGAAQPSSVNLYDYAATNRSIAFTHTGSDLALDTNYYFDAYGGSILVAAPSNSLTYSGGSFYGSSVILTAGNQLDINGSLYNSYGDLALIATTVNVMNYVSANGTLNVTAGTLNNMTSSGTLFAGTDLTMIVGNINGTDGAHFQAVNNINAVVANNITLLDGAHFHAGNDINLALAGVGSTVSMTNGSYMHANVPSTIHIDFAARTAGGIFINGVETTTNDALTGFFVGLGLTPAVPGAGLEITYANAANPANPAILAIFDSNSGQAGETEEERQRRLQQTDDNGESNDPADKPVAQCS
jgi:filamentous hemagglutinin family protein